MNKKGISLPMLIALVISSSIGTAIFTFTSNFAKVAAPGPMLIAWGIVGIGILALALTFSNLINKRPDLDGIFAYAEAGFGPFAGFLSGWGYWLSAWVGNVAFATILVSSIGYFLPIFKSGQNIPSIILASIIAWALNWFVSRGVESATAVNTIVTICKLIPLFVFMVVAIVMFNGHLFTADFWGNIHDNFSNHLVWPQVKQCVMVMMWSFVGIEGATMMSSRARVKSDASKATIIGVITLILLYSIVSLLPYGYYDQHQLAQLPQPSLVYLFSHMVGPIGGAFMSLGLVISILGAWLSWTMLPAETVLLMSEANLLPKYFAHKNRFGAPNTALLITQVLVQLFLCSLLFTNQAYNFAASLCTAAIVITYCFVAAYQIKHSIQNWQQKDAKWQLFVGVVAIAFQMIGIGLTGIQYILLAMIAYIPGIYFYRQARQVAHGKHKMAKHEIGITILIAGCAILAISGLVMGKISL
ncbi:arginine-ornithine antiporter [Periweissella ghanensis]|uniref:Arginine-ornithine antiporter n=1 Tax=Periweissella ghanensis TaxID=467997 RepID=A0ABM8ZBN3_9LACO|nr:arginine-ornithine antiporter [Periweissella ghanensis]MCM0601600.1 arginine-ornithine antiporter [Periweissella ghanensis]CAH0418677.1 Arginine/ornithine antiporter ArcD1 [Periweissella ghanensis]